MTVKKERRQKRLHYKRALLDEPAVLQTMLAAALKELPVVADREEELAGGSRERRFINHYAPHGNLLCGELLFYEEGRDEQAMVFNQKNERPIEAIRAGKSTDGSKREFLESTLYFAVLQNHMVVVQSTALRAESLQHHLNWLLGQKTDQLGKQILILSDELPDESVSKIEKSPIREVRFGGNPFTTEADSLPESKSQRAKTTFVPIGRGASLLNAWFGEGWRDRAEFKDALDEANLDVGLSIRYNRTTTSAGLEALETISRAARNLEDDVVEVELKDGTVLKGDDIKLRHSVPVDTYNGNVDRSALFDAMANWMKKCINDGLI